MLHIVRMYISQKQYGCMAKRGLSTSSISRHLDMYREGTLIDCGASCKKFIMCHIKKAMHTNNMKSEAPILLDIVTSFQVVVASFPHGTLDKTRYINRTAWMFGQHKYVRLKLIRNNNLHQFETIILHFGLQLSYDNQSQHQTVSYNIELDFEE